MWEWLLSHPVRPLASFAAEMLAPMMANPIYLAAPVFWVVLLVSAHELHTITFLPITVPTTTFPQGCTTKSGVTTPCPSTTHSSPYNLREIFTSRVVSFAFR